MVFSSLIFLVIVRRPFGGREPTRTPQPTFTVVPTATLLDVPPTNTPIPTFTATPVLTTVEPPTPTPSPTPASISASTPAPTTPAPIEETNKASVTVSTSLNVRTGPGTSYPTVGALAAGNSADITGRNADSSWWQISYQDAPGNKAWISAKYGEARNTESVPVVEAPKPPPKPTDPPAPQVTPTPQYQYTPTGWEGQWNAGLAQIRGIIRDANGQPVTGVFVQARCGGTVIASNPSGTNLYAPGEGYEAGAYDIILSSPLSSDSFCNWEVWVVEASNYEQAQDPNAKALSPAAYCDLTYDADNPLSICFANWQKNW